MMVCTTPSAGGGGRRSRSARGGPVHARRALVSLTVLATVAATAAAVSVSGAEAVHTPQATIASANPANFTPNVQNGKVEVIAQVGSTIVIGGMFTSIQA